jgi:hypothetical protein
MNKVDNFFKKNILYSSDVIADVYHLHIYVVIEDCTCLVLISGMRMQVQLGNTAAHDVKFSQKLEREKIIALPLFSVGMSPRIVFRTTN